MYSNIQGQLGKIREQHERGLRAGSLHNFSFDFNKMNSANDNLWDKQDWGS